MKRSLFVLPLIWLSCFTPAAWAGSSSPIEHVLVMRHPSMSTSTWRNAFYVNPTFGKEDFYPKVDAFLRTLNPYKFTPVKKEDDPARNVVAAIRCDAFTATGKTYGWFWPFKNTAEEYVQCMVLLVRSPDGSHVVEVMARAMEKRKTSVNGMDYGASQNARDMVEELRLAMSKSPLFK